ncbi:MAG TPA: ferritin-like domain-containing protein [Pirellulales bacterium]
MKLQTLHDLLVHELKDLHSAEVQLVKALPKMAKGASSEKLREGIEKHLEETRTHVERLDKIFEQLEMSSRGKKCKAMEGLIEEGKEMLEEEGEPAVKDAAIIGAAQKVEHYEMAGYGTARTYARLLDLEEIAVLLEQTLSEEKATDAKLTELAESEINVAATSSADQ